MEGGMEGSWWKVLPADKVSICLGVDQQYCVNHFLRSLHANKIGHEKSCHTREFLVVSSTVLLVLVRAMHLDLAVFVSGLWHVAGTGSLP